MNMSVFAIQSMTQSAYTRMPSRPHHCLTMPGSRMYTYRNGSTTLRSNRGRDYGVMPKQAGTVGHGASTCCAATTLSTCPAPAETARTIVDLAAHGTICTITEDGVPLGTYVSYVLDQVGQPIIRLRRDAVHTGNLMRDARCSLFVQPSEYPAHALARITLIGNVEPVSEEIAASAAALHHTLHAGGAGVDAPRDDDVYYRLVVDEGFYVGQLSGDSAADIISGDAYREAEADPLRTVSTSLVRSLNTDRMEDVFRIRYAGDSVVLCLYDDDSVIWYGTNGLLFLGVHAYRTNTCMNSYDSYGTYHLQFSSYEEEH